MLVQSTNSSKERCERSLRAPLYTLRRRGRRTGTIPTTRVKLYKLSSWIRDGKRRRRREIRNIKGWQSIRRGQREDGEEWTAERKKILLRRIIERVVWPSEVRLQVCLSIAPIASAAGQVHGFCHLISKGTADAASLANRAGHIIRRSDQSIDCLDVYAIAAS